MTRHSRAAATAVGLCLATVSTTPSLAFQLPHPGGRGVVGARRSTCHDNASGSRRSVATACRLAVQRDGHDDHERRTSEALDDGTHPRSSGRGGSKDVAALVLSALLLGSPQLSDAATPSAGAVKLAKSQVVDTTAQDRLMADLERRLTRLSGSSDQATAQAPAAASSSAASSHAPKPAAATVTLPAGDDSDAPQAAAAAAAESERISASPTTGAARGSTRPVGVIGNGEPIVRLQEHTFSITLPELNLPPVGPITVPAEGGLFTKPTFGRVAASPALSEARGGVTRALGRAGWRSGAVDKVVDAIRGMVPKQADYNR